MKIYIHRLGKTYGAYSRESIERFIIDGLVDNQDLGWTSGLDEWTPVCEILRFNLTQSSWLKKALETGDEESSFEIVHWICEHCGLKPLEVDAKRMYVTDDFGKRHLCRHPLEYLEVKKHLGEDAPDQLLIERTGHYEDHLCCECFKISLIDEKRDKMICPQCNSRKIKKGISFANQKCPKCKTAHIRPVYQDTKFLEELIEEARIKLADES